jgi:tricorn protease
VGREGGEARRLTTGIGLETDPVFSPDGSRIAFTGEYDGNFDVYVMPSEGGQPKRLTYHPGIDIAVGWTPDGKSVLFHSGRASASRYNKLFTVPAEGGFPTELPLPMAEEGSFSPDGSQIAYVPFWNRRAQPSNYIAWKRYRGGLASPVWIASLADNRIERIPRTDSNDFDPMWIEDKVHFLSDRNGPVSLFVYDTHSKNVSQALPNDGMDIKSASSCADAIVYDQFGAVHIFDVKTGQDRVLPIHVAGDLPGLRPHFEKVAKGIQNASISPNGVRAAFEARGEILTVPAEKGDIRNLTQSPGIAERDPAWSPDGKSIAYFSDESGEYQLHIRDQKGEHAPLKFKLGNAPSFYYRPTWSPDSKKIVYTDKRMNIWYLDVATGKSTKIDTDRFDSPLVTLLPTWSPDNRWIAYAKQLPNHLHAAFVYNLASGKSHQVTDGMSDVRTPVFDKSGKYLFFIASTDAGPAAGWLDLSSINLPVSSSVYVMVLRKDSQSPLAPESDDEKADETSHKPIPSSAPYREKPGEHGPGALQQAGDSGTHASAEVAATDRGDAKKKKKSEEIRIDFDGLDQRILALPLPVKNYVGLGTGKAGILFVIEGPDVPRSVNATPAQGASLTLWKFDLTKRKPEKLAEGIAQADISASGEKMLIQRGKDWSIVSTAAPAKPGDGALKLDAMEVQVDPVAEWKQMYHEVWRIQRDFLYDPGAHGLDLKAAEEKYAPYLDHLACRADLNYLFNDMLGELTLGHTYVNGGDLPEVKGTPGGLLGADYEIDSGRYRFARVYNGENWNPKLRAPLTQPGVNAKAGEYLLAVNGKDLKSTDSVYEAFLGTADKATVLHIGPSADGKGARDVTVVPVMSETALRNLAWIEGNRRKVDQQSGGKLAYVYLPNTSTDGYTNFNRYYFAQIDKQGVILDERFNGGGSAADYVIDHLRRPLLNYWTTREGDDFTTPLGSIFGPKVMIINEFAGSGGDAMPWYFRHAGCGPLIGKRTWGGLVGIYSYPQLIDGGAVTAPRLAFWNPDGQWEVENHGVAPDIEVEYDPQAVLGGHDPQLERAVQVAMEELAKNPLPHPKHPAFPNYHKGAAKGGEPATGSSGRR